MGVRSIGLRKEAEGTEPSIASHVHNTTKEQKQKELHVSSQLNQILFR